MLLSLLGALPLAAADLGSTCCADLEARIADLEAFAARSQNRKFELTLSGAVNHAVLVWDDGRRRDATVVANDNDNSVATVEGEVRDLGHGWSAGFVVDFDVLTAGSGDISQNDRASDRTVEPGQVAIWFKNDQLGEVSIGQTSARGASSGASEQDLSGTEVAGYSGVTDVGGGFFLRRGGASDAGGLLNLTWDDVIDSLDEPDGNVVTYSSPDFAGASFSALWGEDDIWNAGIGYHRTFDQSLQIAAALAVNENQQGEAEGLIDHRTISGSVSILHLASGLSLTVAGGQRTYLRSVALADGREGRPDEPHFYYSKVGWQGAVVPAGMTAVYAEFGQFSDFLGADADAGKLQGLDGFGAGEACNSPGSACFVSRSEAQVWGAGVVQEFDEANVKLYLSYRHFDAAIDVSNAPGGQAISQPLTALETLMTGMLIEF